MSGASDDRDRLRSAFHRYASSRGTLGLVHARLHRLGVHLKALGAGDRRAGGGELGTCAAQRTDPHLGHAPAEVPRGERRGEAGGAVRRQHVVGAGDIVAEGRRRAGADEQAAGASAPSARAPRARRRSAAGARGRTRWRARSPRARRRTCTSAKAASATVGCSTTSRSSARASASSTACGRARPPRRGCPRRARPGRACPAPPAALAGARVRAEHDQQVARAGEPVDARRSPESCALGLLHVQVPRPDDHIHAPHRLGSVGERGDRLRAAHPVHALDPAQPAGAEDRRVDAPVASGRGAHGDVDHARGARGDDAHHDRARVGRAAARHVHGGGLHGHLAQQRPAAPAELDRDVLAHAGLGDLGDVGDRDLQPRDELERQLDRLVELLLRDEQRPSASAPAVSKRACSRARPRRRVRARPRRSRARPASTLSPAGASERRWAATCGGPPSPSSWAMLSRSKRIGSRGAGAGACARAAAPAARRSAPP